ncbi:MATE family efflux transporter [soil metagenome]
MIVGLRRILRRGPHDREILRLAVPALGALIAEPLYVLTDTAIVGRLGTPQLGGLAVATTVLLTLYAVFIFLAYGTTGAVGRLLGAGDARGAAHQAVQGLWLAAVIGVTVTVVGLLAAPWLVGALGATGAVRTNALVYLRISLLGVPPLLLILAGTGYLRGLQDTRTPLLVAVGTVVANLLLQVWFIYGLGYGIGASALSTVLAQTVGAIVYVRIVVRGARRHHVDARPDPGAIRALAVVGRDLFVRTLALRAALVLATAVATRIGVADLGAHQIAFEIWSFLALALDAIAIAGQAMIGRLLGAGDRDGARAAGRRMVEWGVMAGVASGAAVLILRPVLPRIFTTDPEVLALTGFVLWFVAVLQPVNAVAFVLDGVLIGAGDQRFLAGAMVFAAAVFAAVAVPVLALDLGIGWLWAALGVLMASRVAVLGARFHGGRWAVVGATR